MKSQNETPLKNQPLEKGEYSNNETWIIQKPRTQKNANAKIENGKKSGVEVSCELCYEMGCEKDGVKSGVQTCVKSGANFLL